jgi:hypothetical protein
LSRGPDSAAANDRPLERLDLAGPVQFVLGDSALSQPVALPLEAYDAKGKPVGRIAGLAHVLKPAVAIVRGDSVVPKGRGVSLMMAWAGARNAATGVHIYQRVDSTSLDTLLRVDPALRQFAVPISVRRRDTVSVALPPGEWMVSTIALPGRASDAFRLQFMGAACKAGILNDPNRYSCRASAGSKALVTLRRGDEAPVTGYFLVRGFFPGPPSVPGYVAPWR